MPIPRNPLTPEQQKLQKLKEKRRELKKQLINLSSDAVQAEKLLNAIIDLSLKITAASK